MRSDVFVLMLSTCVLLHQGAIVQSARSSSSSSSSSSGSSSSGSSSSGSSSSGSSSSSSSSSNSRSAASSSIRCIGYMDTHIRTTENNIDVKYAPFNQDCPKDTKCATWYLNGEKDGQYVKFRYSGCSTTTFTNKPIDICAEGSHSETLTVDGVAFTGHIDCCSSDHCNQKSPFASLSVRKVTNPETLSTEKKAINGECANSADEFEMNELFNQNEELLKQNEKLQKTNKELEARTPEVVYVTPLVPLETTTEVNSSGIAFITLSTLLSAITYML